MALSDDQRAMLQLVLQHGQSYEDISALQGIEVEKVRSSARDDYLVCRYAPAGNVVGVTVP